MLPLLITLYEIILMIRICFLLCASASLLACNSGIDQKMSEQQPAPSLQNSAQPAAPTTAQPASTSAPSTATGAVNPPHGQPGHNCDIAVGAPLSGATAPAQNGTVAPAGQPSGQPALTVQPGTGAPANVRLNPPHGQPGHNCAVEVGKPL